MEGKEIKDFVPGYSKMNEVFVASHSCALQLLATINTASRVETMRDTLTNVFNNKYRHTLNKQRLYE
jgi:hypothetical protein